MLRILLSDFMINILASSKLVPHEIRFFLYKVYGINVQTNCIHPNCFMGGNNISIGKCSFINYGCIFDNSAYIEIGDNCSIGMEVMFCTSSHEFGNENQRAGVNTGKPIIIEKGCWIGTRATILPGVTVGHGCVIAAGALVTRDCEPNGLYAGVPARRVKDLPMTALQQNVE